MKHLACVFRIKSASDSDPNPNPAPFPIQSRHRFRPRSATKFARWGANTAIGCRGDKGPIQAKVSLMRGSGRSSAQIEDPAHRSRWWFSWRATGLLWNLTFEEPSRKLWTRTAVVRLRQPPTKTKSRLNDCIRKSRTDAADPKPTLSINKSGRSQSARTAPLTSSLQTLGARPTPQRSRGAPEYCSGNCGGASRR